MYRSLICAALATLITGISAGPATAEDQDKQRQVLLAEDKISFVAPAQWERKQPRTRIVEHEFAAPAVEDDEVDGRLTIMGAGGTVKQNIDRWIGQFSQPDGKSTAQVANIEKGKIAGQQVHLVDISGTFKDQPGPFAPAVVRENYRMLGAIIVTEELGQYFLKFYGPHDTITANKKAFIEMVESMKVK